MQLAAGCVSRAHAAWDVGLAACCTILFFFLLRAGGCGIIAIRLCFYIFCLRLGMILLGVWLLGLKIFFLARAARAPRLFLFYKRIIFLWKGKKKRDWWLQLLTVECLPLSVCSKCAE